MIATVLVGAVVLATASPNGLVIEYRSKGAIPMVLAGDVITRLETRPGRVRLESSTTGPIPGVTQTVVDIILADRNIEWIIDLSDSSYIEIPWPDSVYRRRVLESFERAKAAMPDSMRSRMPALNGEPVIERTAQRDTIRGYSAEKVIVRSAFGSLGDSGDVPGNVVAVAELWMAEETANIKVAARLLEESDRLLSESGSKSDLAPWSGDGKQDKPWEMHGMDGVPVRMRASLQSSDAPQGDIAPEAVLMESELSELTIGPLAEDRFALPPGLKKKPRPDSIWDMTPAPKKKSSRSSR
jgi:hypothetical protein